MKIKVTIFIVTFQTMFHLNAAQVNPNTPLGPHRNLTHQNMWCWMDAALQCFAANDTIVEELKKVTKLEPWQAQLRLILTQIRKTNLVSRPSAEGLYNSIVPKLIQEKKIKQYGQTYDAKEFHWWLLNNLLGPADTKPEDRNNYPLGSIAQEFLIKSVITYKKNPYEMTTQYTYSSFLDVKYIPNTDISTQRSFYSTYFFSPHAAINTQDWATIQRAISGNLTGIYDCYAINLGEGGHAMALVKNKFNQWYLYNDMNSRPRADRGEFVDYNTVDNAVKTGTWAGSTRVTLLFYRKISTFEIPIQATSLESVSTPVGPSTSAQQIQQPPTESFAQQPHNTWMSWGQSILSSGWKMLKGGSLEPQPSQKSDTKPSAPTQPSQGQPTEPSELDAALHELHTKLVNIQTNLTDLNTNLTKLQKKLS